MAPHEAVAAEVRAELARQQLSGIRAARSLGWTQNYIAVRLRAEVPFSIDDLQAIADLLDVQVTKFFVVLGALAGSVTALHVTGTEVRKRGSCPPLAVAA